MSSDSITHHGRQHLDELFKESENGLGVRQCDKTEQHWQHEWSFARDAHRAAKQVRGWVM